MLTMPPALAGLADYQQFMLWRIQYRPGDDKPTKVPVDRRGVKVSSLDPANYMTYADAASASAESGLGVAFVLTDNDPFFFLDIDHAYNDGQWSKIAVEMCERFSGAGIELSQSRTGLHIIGHGLPPYRHKTKHQTDAFTLELYTSRRFIALTGLHAGGDVNTIHQEQLDWLCANHFPESRVDLSDEAWTDEPCDGWDGFTDDNELLAHAFSKSSIYRGDVFSRGHEIYPFAEMYSGDVAALAVSHPDGEGGVDWSSVDQAMANSLAYWTGKDCDRMWRLMWASGLEREKWNNHKTYLKGTILKAIAYADSVHTFVKPPRDQQLMPTAPPPPAPPPAAPAAGNAVHDQSPTAPPATVCYSMEPEVRDGTQLMTSYDQLAYFKGCCYVRDLERVFTPGGKLLKREQFDVTYSGYDFYISSSNDKSTASAFAAFTHSQANRYPIADTTTFRPELPMGTIIKEHGDTMLNIYNSPVVRMISGDPSPMIDHMRKLFPDANDLAQVLSYMAACVQHKGHKFKWCPVIQGVPGNGKTTLSHVVSYAVGEQYTSWPRADQIAKPFTQNWLEDKLLVAVEDISVGEHQADIIEALKPMITNQIQPVEDKGSKQHKARIVANFIINTNHKSGMGRLNNDRRYAVYLTPQQRDTDLTACGMNEEYFSRLYNWLDNQDGYAIFAKYLHDYDIPRDMNPAVTAGGLATRRPVTSTMDQALEASMTMHEQVLHELVQEGTPGFNGGWVSFTWMQKEFERRNFKMRTNRMTEILDDMGYIKHPALGPDGRTGFKVSIDDGKRTRLYVHKTCAELLAIDTAQEVARRYVEAQDVTTMSKLFAK